MKTQKDVDLCQPVAGCEILPQKVQRSRQDMIHAHVAAEAGRGAGGTDLKYVFEMELRRLSHLIWRLEEKEEPSITHVYLYGKTK